MQNINLRDAFFCKKQLDFGLVIFSLRYIKNDIPLGHWARVYGSKYLKITNK